MTEKQLRTKLCVHCEGRVPFDAGECPYCGSSLTFDGSSPEAPSETTSSGEKSEFYYEPPYKGGSGGHTQERIPDVQSRLTSPSEERIRLLPVLLFSVGVLLITISLLIFTLSSSRTIIFEVKSGLWPLYFVFGLPMAYFGYSRLGP